MGAPIRRPPERGCLTMEDWRRRCGRPKQGGGGSRREEIGFSEEGEERPEVQAMEVLTQAKGSLG